MQANSLASAVARLPFAWADGHEAVHASDSGKETSAMNHPRLWLILGVSVYLAWMPAMIQADNTVPSPAKATAPATALDPQQLAARIDQLIAVRLAAEGVPPAPVAEDAEFL